MSPRDEGRDLAAELLTRAMGFLGLADRDVAIALNVSETVVRGMRHRTRPFTFGDYLVLRRRLPALYSVLRDAVEPQEAA